MQHGGNVWEGGNPESWLDFSASLRPEGCPEWVKEAASDAVNDVRYYPDRQMRKAVKGLSVYAGVPEDRILPTAGGTAAIDLAVSASNGRVLVPAHAFSEYALRARCRGRETAVWTGECRKNDAVVICNPDNPTGRLYKRRDILRMHEEISASGAVLIADEAFIDYCPEESVRDMACESLIVVGSLTKILGIPGIRLGYLIADSGTVNRISQSALPWSLSAFASKVAERLPLHIDDIRADAKLNEARRNQLSAGLEALGAEVMPSGANFVLADFKRDMTRAARQLEQKGILVRTCASFGLPPEMLRIAVRTDEENLILLEALRQLTEE